MASGVWQTVQLYTWGARQLARHGKPDVALGFLGSIGDDLLCTAPIQEWLQRGARRVWFLTRHPDLYSHFDDRVQLLADEARNAHLARRLGCEMRYLSYSTYDAESDRDSPVDEHLIAAMCRRAGLSGRVRLRPHLPLHADELTAAVKWSGSIAVQAASMSAALAMKNKQWPAERFQTVVDHLVARGHPVVQIGSDRDPPLRGAVDLRGRTRLRETAAVLAHARLFVGLVGFLMHLARAVECPAVIVYGGREPPELTGYPCNHNVTHRPACAPCWQRNRCDHSHECMDAIDAPQVVTACDQMLAQARGPLAEAEAVL